MRRTIESNGNVTENDLKKNDRGDGIEREILKNETDSLIETEREIPAKETVVSNEAETNDVSSGFKAEEACRDWLKYYNQPNFFEPFPGGEAVQEFRRWEQSVRKQQLSQALIPLMEENEDSKGKSSEVKDVMESDDEELNPLLKLMLQPTIYIWENFDDQKPLKWLSEDNQKTPSDVRAAAVFSDPWGGPGEWGEATEPAQECSAKKLKRKWFSCKSLRKSRKEKKRAPGFLARFFR
ncbi:uncharacterized protein LOC128165947 [Crassostrea angulata]|uniref:uncharacterized protein LOC128165947 n=1 Tax=Magallana angulata TaxID=2784310 RepID=UPI0022B16EF6|nr:uncharacterized protein LOC128165947 [Crassostrea angulata]